MGLSKRSSVFHKNTFEEAEHAKKSRYQPIPKRKFMNMSRVSKPWELVAWPSFEELLIKKVASELVLVVLARSTLASFRNVRSEVSPVWFRSFPRLTAGSNKSVLYQQVVWLNKACHGALVPSSCSWSALNFLETKGYLLSQIFIKLATKKLIFYPKTVHHDSLTTPCQSSELYTTGTKDL
ncbi:hypothetical protein CEXT_150801 [Caerostris extrusa]|uniref:Uncharacterized protein n=1 Tax=Caerostris extrusa TaxID=172846 RepID=A0AAV4PAD4_CAEEX|nr:hypothetical protein CEXT_150801 [Caerostris extrusa]